MTASQEYNTQWARRKRKRLWAERAQFAEKCPAMLGRGKPCNTRLESRFVDGVTVPFCPTCDRKARGVCIDCHTAPVYGTVRKALRCAVCAKLAVHAFHAKYRKSHRAKMRRKERERAGDPDRLEYKRLWRQSRPAKVAADKKRWQQENQDKVRAYHQRYRAERRAERAERERLRHHGKLPPRTCLSCDTVLTGRAKKCDFCKQEARRVARATIAERLERAA